MRKILHFIDKKCFGNQVVVYTGEIRHREIYFVVVEDRGEITYFFVDNNLQRMYPVNSYIASLGYEFDINEAPDKLDNQFDVDLTRYGSSICPAFLADLIKQNTKRKCYSKYSYVSFFVLAIISLAFSIAPLFISTDEALVLKVIWSTAMLLFGAIFFTGAIHNMQYFYFEDDCLIVKSAFGTIVKLTVSESIGYIETLPTYSSWAGPIKEKWICIYDKSIAHNFSFRFKSGCANKKQFQRVQIHYSEENRAIIERFIKIDTRKVF